jgi:multiple sugar transport system permease protein
MSSIKNRRFNIPQLMVLPTIIFILAVSVYPLIYSFYMTLHDWSLTRAEPPTFVGIGNYI